jgi:uncharacterized protein
MNVLEQKERALRRTLSDLGSALVAFSGGVDSSFLLRIAAETLGERCVALTTISPVVPADDASAARTLADDLGVRHLVVSTNELEIPSYASNPTNRCYFCKDNLFRICKQEADRLHIAHIVDGANVDDLRDHRPGLAAAADAGVRHPLVEAGLAKDEIRALSRRLGLATWDRPSSPCLSSRIPYGTSITRSRLTQVAAAEAFLRARGFRELRVRHHDQIARIEAPVVDLPRLLDPTLRAATLAHFRELGFVYVTVDLAGFRSGSLNEVLAGPPVSPTASPASRAPREGDPEAP